MFRFLLILTLFLVIIQQALLVSADSSSISSISFVPTREETLKEYTFPTQQQPTSSSNTPPFFTLSPTSQQQCSCSQCYCNNGGSCPKSIPALGFTILAAEENCGNRNQVPSIGLINIQSTSDSNGFKYYLVDENNKNKAMNLQSFQYSSYKSEDRAMTCVTDNLAPVRYPSTLPGKAYLLVSSTNLVLNTEVRYNIQMSCAVPEAKTVKVTAVSRDGSKYYVGKKMSFRFEFKNVYDNIDTWQKGTLSFGGFTGQVNQGVGNLDFTPSSEGSISLSVLYTPDTSVYGSANTYNTPTIQVSQAPVPDAVWSLWDWIISNQRNAIFAIIILCGIVIGVVLTCCICTCIICRRRRNRANSEERGIKLQDEEA
ncbi:predicted protein [Naegleria gruberi]|uniref:Predicted protein n=1 Tax=Naegleria gruberi TaxID=5762 RepID=D2VII3_NAEGR|nr:uncharacterized protein NAEGRDRAFT_68692 [Naegleria gruberi]EFC43270.1 predicted protein [Naegleria gruberi]|eukprot:XP_002676014.1 predicted protein [Naegleria gruberi strain NEG-M]